MSSDLCSPPDPSSLPSTRAQQGSSQAQALYSSLPSPSRLFQTSAQSPTRKSPQEHLCLVSSFGNCHSKAAQFLPKVAGPGPLADETEYTWAKVAISAPSWNFWLLLQAIPCLLATQSLDTGPEYVGPWSPWRREAKKASERPNPDAEPSAKRTKQE